MTRCGVVCGTPDGSPVGSFARRLPSVLPTSTPPVRPGHIPSKINDRTCFKVELDKATFGPEGPQFVLTVLPPVAFHETRGVPALSHQLSDEFLQCFVCLYQCYVLIAYCVVVSEFPYYPYCHMNQDT